MYLGAGAGGSGLSGLSSLLGLGQAGLAGKFSQSNFFFKLKKKIKVLEQQVWLDLDCQAC